DWLIIPDAPLPHQQLDLGRAPLELADRVILADALPLRTVWYYYGSNLPLEHQQGPRVSLRLYRVAADFRPASGGREPPAACREQGAHAPRSPVLRPERARDAHTAREALDLAR